eukprot:TRINITY_DN12042_c0_g1_i1.p1 TRINITY_DN12042_c0_g1~~TRINITY_DN12042_c0_g1_i1.p1  ORF type:complete len:163 (-),score=0.65 TRINITY_DN12042_c0_g1_i1:3-491(-)
MRVCVYYVLTFPRQRGGLAVSVMQHGLPTSPQCGACGMIHPLASVHSLHAPWIALGMEALRHAARLTFGAYAKFAIKEEEVVSVGSGTPSMMGTATPSNMHAKMSRITDNWSISEVGDALRLTALGAVCLSGGVFFQGVQNSILLTFHFQVSLFMFAPCTLR